MRAAGAAVEIIGTPGGAKQCGELQSRRVRQARGANLGTLRHPRRCAAVAACSRLDRSWRRPVALEPLIIFLVIGAVAGWLAGVIVKGYGFGLAGNVLVGVV